MSDKTKYLSFSLFPMTLRLHGPRREHYVLPVATGIEAIPLTAYVRRAMRSAGRGTMSNAPGMRCKCRKAQEKRERGRGRSTGT